MLNDLFINMLILISFISLGSQIIKNIHFDEKLSLKIKILFGLTCGSLGCILMIYGLQVNGITIIDFRNIALILSEFFGGPVSLIVAGIIIAIFRISYFGINISAVFGVIVICINVIGLLFIRQLKTKAWIKWGYSTGFTLIIYNLALYILLNNKYNYLYIIFIYVVSHCFVSMLVYMYVNYSITTNKMFRRLQKESTKDYLTDLNNVRQFDMLLGNAIKNAKIKEENLSFLMIDIDFFKKVNDTYGHQEGDIVLRELAGILVKSCRTFDIVSRNGGEEFSVILLDCPNSQALRIAERIRKYVNGNLFTLSTGAEIPITVSIGVASYPETLDDIDKIVECSDIALYKAKRSGRNRVCT